MSGKNYITNPEVLKKNYYKNKITHNPSHDKSQMVGPYVKFQKWAHH